MTPSGAATHSSRPDSIIRPRRRPALLASIVLGGGLTACTQADSGKATTDTKAASAPKASVTPPSDGVAIKLPPGFTSRVFVKDLGLVRHIAVRANGDVYANLRKPNASGQSLVALRDADNDGKPEKVEYFGGHGGGTGITIYDGHLYFSSKVEVFRKRWANDDELVPSGPIETIVTGLPPQNSHAAKSIVIDDQGRLYVNVAAPSNACQKKSRFPGSPGLRPCPQLEKQGSVWRFSARKVGQTLEQDGVRHATGLRNMVALAWNEQAGQLYGVQHGRDQLYALFSGLYSKKESAELPAEEFLRLTEGFVGGWPYTYFDPMRGVRMVAPEYGGDGRTESPKGKYPDPVHAFPAHYAPNGLHFYVGAQFPKRYQQGAFVAFRGSWNRGDFGQAGYRVDFLPMNKGEKTAAPEVFADGFAGSRPLKTSRDAKFRPMGLAEAPDGSLYISDTEEGWIWQIRYAGS